MNPEKIAKIESIILRLFRLESDVINGAKLFQSGSNTLNFNFSSKPQCSKFCPCNGSETHRVEIREAGLSTNLNRAGFHHFIVSINNINIVLVDISDE